MVTVVMETGAGLANANSYADVAYADSYFAAHPFYADAWDELDDATKAVLLVSATRALDVQFLWHGYRATSTQALEWPRQRVRDLYDTLISANVVPERVRQATCEMAYYLTKGDRSPENSTVSGLDRLKIDVIELEYSSSVSSSATAPVSTSVRDLLRGLADYMTGMRVRKVVVG